MVSIGVGTVNTVALQNIPSSNLFVPICCLPAELLGEIFDHVVTLRLYRLPEIFALTQVCRRFRVVAHGMKRLWTHLELILKGTNRKNDYFSVTKDILQRGDKLPLNLRLIFQLSSESSRSPPFPIDLSPSPDVLLPFCGRLFKLTLYVVCSKPIYSFIRALAPNLLSLEVLKLALLRPSRGSISFEDIGEALSFSSSIKLRTVEKITLDSGRLLRFLTFPMNTLTYLVLDYHRDEKGFRVEMDVDVLLEFLRPFINLTTLIVMSSNMVSGRTWVNRDRVVTLPALEFLTLDILQRDNPSGRQYYCLLNSIRAPHLQMMALYVEGPLDRQFSAYVIRTLCEFQARSNAPIDVLALHGVRLHTVAIVERLLTPFPTITGLSYHLPTGALNHDYLDLLLTRIDNRVGVPLILPALEYLEFDLIDGQTYKNGSSRILALMISRYSGWLLERFEEHNRLEGELHYINVISRGNSGILVDNPHCRVNIGRINDIRKRGFWVTGVHPFNN